MKPVLLTNISVYKAIVEAAYRDMKKQIEAGRKPKANGTIGYIVVYDPDRRSLKHALIAIVFTCMWIEAFFHLIIMEQYGKDIFKKYDHKSYEEKLKLFGCTDQSIIEGAKRLRKTRAAIIHEKAYYDAGDVKLAEREAELAYNLLLDIERVITKTHHGLESNGK